MPALRAFAKNEFGAAMVEFALVVSLVFIPLVFGIIEFGRATWAKNMITAAAREGARYAIVRAVDGTDGNAVSTYVTGRIPLSPLTVKTDWSDSVDVDPGYTVVVKVSYVYTPIVRVIPGKTLVSTSRQIIAN